MPFLSEMIAAVRANPVAAASAFIAGIALIVSIFSLGVSAFAARNSKRAADAAILHGFLTQYASPEMHEALQKLRDFKDEEGPLLKYLQRLHEARPDSLDQHDVATAELYVKQHEPGEVGKARRRVHFHYKRAWRLWRGGYMPKRALQVILESNGADLLLEVARPLSIAVNLINLSIGAQC